MSNKAFDCQTPATAEMIASAARAGGRGFLRYHYNLTRPEVDRIIGAGQGVSIIHETDGRLHPDQGEAHAIAVNTAADRCGLPNDPDTWCWFTPGDSYIPSWQWPQLGGYMDATQTWYFPPGAVTRSRTRPAAYYGGQDEGLWLFDNGKSRGTWTAAATSFSDGHYFDNAAVCLRQHPDASPVPFTDWNEILTTRWGQYDPTIAPGGTPVEMLTVDQLREELVNQDTRTRLALLAIHAEEGQWMQDQARNVVVFVNAAITAATQQIITHLAPAGSPIDAGAIYAAVGAAISDELRKVQLRTEFVPVAQAADQLPAPAPAAS